MTRAENVLMSSSFLDKVRMLKFDQGEFGRLIDALESLVDEWREETHVNKAVAAELFLLPTIVRSMAQNVHDAGQRNIFVEAADELESLALQCLMGE